MVLCDAVQMHRLRRLAECGAALLQGASRCTPANAVQRGASRAASNSADYAFVASRIPQAAASSSSAVPGAAATVSAGTTRVTSLRELMQVYKQLSKAKLSLLVVSTAAAGYVLGSGETVDWKGMAWCSLGTFCAASCANTLNQVYEVANDARMKRTRNRPLPLGKISKLHALGFAAAMGITGTAVLLHTVSYYHLPNTAAAR